MTVRREPITRTRVGETAFDLVSRGGFDALSLRGVAAALGASAPSLYEHVRNKEEIVDLVVDRILLDAADTWDPPTEWADVLRYTARWWHGVLTHHPALLASVQRRPQAHPTALQSIECLLEALVGAGCTVDEAVAVYVQMFGFVTGMAAAQLLREQAGRRSQPGTAPPPDLPALLRSLPAATFPLLRQTADDLSSLVSVDHFEAALDLWADGIEALLDQRGR